MTTNSLLAVVAGVLCFVCLSFVTSEKPFWDSNNRKELEKLSDRPAKSGKASRIVEGDAGAFRFLVSYGYLKPITEPHRTRKRHSPPGIFADAPVEENGEKLILDSETAFLGGTSEEKTKSAIKKALLHFQETFGIERTGVVDEATKEVMNRGRCGNSDKNIEESLEKAEKKKEAQKSGSGRRRRGAVDAVVKTEIRRKRASLLQTAISHSPVLKRLLKKRARRSLPANSLQDICAIYPTGNIKLCYWTLDVEDIPAYLNIGQVKKAIKKTLFQWTKAIPVIFAESTNAHLRFGFKDVSVFGLDHLSPMPVARTVMYDHTVSIELNKDIHFTEHPSNNDDVDFVRALLHEGGHALGQKHLTTGGAMMFPSFPVEVAGRGDGTALSVADKKQAADSSWGPCSGTVDTVFDYLRRDASGSYVYNTYFFKNGKHAPAYWMYENQNKQARAADPQLAAPNWPNVTQPVHEVLHILYRNGTDVVNKYFFFSGDFVQEYNSTADRGEQSYKVVEYFPGIPAEIDSAFFDLRVFGIYFFKKDMVYFFDMTDFNFDGTDSPGTPNRVLRHRKINEEFPPEPGSNTYLIDPHNSNDHISAMYYSFTHNKVFIFKQENFYENTKYTFSDNSALGDAVKFKERWNTNWPFFCPHSADALLLDDSR